MAATAPVEPEKANPCCAAWQRKYFKSEKLRNHLREAVNILQKGTEEVQAQHSALKKEYEELRVVADIEKEEKMKESAARVSLENEISELKCEILSLKQREGADSQDKDEIELLKGQVSDREEEISRLKELIEREKKRAESESKKAEVEKKRAAESQKNMKIEKKKADEERKRANIEGEKAENYRLQLEVLEKEVAKAKSNSEGEKEIRSLKELIEREKKRAESESKNAEVEKKKAAEALKSMKTEKRKADEERKRANVVGEKAENYRLRLEVLEKEADKAKSDLASETLKLEVTNKNLEAEKQKVVKERECANSEKAKAEELRKLVETNWRKTIEEKSCAESLSLQLVESRKRVDELQKELNEVRCSTKLHADLGVQPHGNRIDASKEISCLEEANKKYEVEKQKAMKEKRRADSEAMKTQKQRQLAEVNLKKAVEEKSRADHLSRQLDEAKKEIEELSTRKLIEVSAVQQLAKGMDSESVKVKLLKKRLKLEKMQSKHSKEVVKLERNRNSILHQELGRLKLDCDQISQRLYMLNNSFSYNAEGIDDLEKTWNIMKKQRLSNKNYQESDSLQMNLQSGTDFLKPGFPVLDASDPFREAMQHTGPYPLSGGNCTGSISGIDSKLESPRGSKRNMLKSSAINSSTASFSDGQLVGSQEKGAFSVTVPTKLVDENVQPAIFHLSTEVIKRKCDETIDVVAENTVRSPVRTNCVGKVNERSRKRKRIIDAVESIGNLYCEGKKFHQQVEEKLSDLHCLLSNKSKKPVEERLHEEREALCGGKWVLTNGSVRNEQNNADRFKNECANVCRQVSEIGGELIGTAQASRDRISDSDFSDIASFDEVTDGNYMKLLELDNPADEECYRMAMEVPLSPTLPEFQAVEASQVNKINLSIKESICNGYSNKNGGHVDCCDIQGLNGNGSGKSVAMGKPWDIQVHDAGAEVVSNAPILRNKVMFPFGSDGAAGDNIFQYHVVFSNTEDSNSLSRICDASRSCIAQCSLATHTEWIVRDILFAVKSEEKLLPKEKVCVLFSLLLLNFTIASSSKFGSMCWESNPCLDSFARQVCSVMSDGDGRRIFSEFGCLDESLGLIEDFIIQGRVFVCMDALTMDECHSSSFLHGNIDISPRPASADELVAGSIVLASLCAAFDHIGFICETSYNILLIRGLDRSLVLKMLHVFAYMGGEKFFNFSNYSLVNVLKSIVRFLEGVSNSGNEFCPCVECPFSDDSVSVDTAISFLLERVMQSDNSNTDLTLCDLSDLLSLVELVASNMSWTWTSVKVVPQLMKIVESCNAENVIAGVVVLLGQLGRLGVDSVGYEDKGVKFLRNELSAFLCRDSATSTGLPTQIATVTSMLSLMSSDFRTIIQSNVNPSGISSQSDPAQSIRKWFSLLPKKQQELSSSLLQAASVDKSRDTL